MLLTMTSFPFVLRSAMSGLSLQMRQPVETYTKDCRTPEASMDYNTRYPRSIREVDKTCSFGHKFVSHWSVLLRIDIDSY